MRFLADEKWTAEQLSRWEQFLQALGRSRRTLAEIARRELGYEMADLAAGTADVAVAPTEAGQSQPPKD